MMEKNTMMMNNLLGIFSAEFASTVLGLTGQGAAVGEAKEFEAKAQSGINPPVITASVSSTSGKLLFMATPLLMTAINDIMLGEEKPTMNENIFYTSTNRMLLNFGYDKVEVNWSKIPLRY